MAENLTSPGQTPPALIQDADYWHTAFSLLQKRNTVPLSRGPREVSGGDELPGVVWKLDARRGIEKITKSSKSTEREK